MMQLVRPAAIAGSFYPAELRTMVDGFLRENHTLVMSRPKAIIVPHTGYQFSGPIAATAYAQLLSIADSIERIVLLGPAHHVGFRGIAVCNADFFETPLGRVSIDVTSVERLLSLPQVRVLDEAHVVEHSLEVQLPFLQVAIPDGFLLTPMAVGDAGGEDMADVLNTVWGGPETVLVVSSDLNHYHDYATARRLDQETTRWIETLQPDRLSSERACGYAGIRGLLTIAARRHLHVNALDVRNSGDTAGPRDQVVGYGAYIIH